jgi:hypothetical protein
MGKSQRQRRRGNKPGKVTFSLKEFHTPPPLKPNQYLYQSVCSAPCPSVNTCLSYCEPISVPTGGIKEFYICTASGEKVEKWQERYYLNHTPTKYTRVWVTPRPSYRYRGPVAYPGVPWGGYVVTRGDGAFHSYEDLEIWEDYCHIHPEERRGYRNPLKSIPCVQENAL